VDVLDLRLAAAQRLVLAVVVVLAAVAVWRPMPDPFMLPKMAAVLFGAVVLLSLSAVRALRSSRLTLPGPVALWPAVALTLVLVLATLTADNVGLSTFGQHRRYAGLLPYLAYVVVFLVAARLYVSGQPRGLVRAVVGSFAVVTGYGLLQVAGLDPYTWSSNGLDQTFSTMGNINFAAGYIAATAPVLAAVSLLRGWSPAWRWTAFGLLVLGAVYLLVNGSAQGPIAAAAGLTVVAVAWLQLRRGTSSSLLPKDRRARTAALVAAAGGLLAAGLLAAQLAPQVVDSLSERRYFWRASFAIFGDHPLLGTGLDSFRDHFPRYRAPEHAVLLGFDNADSPHSLPLSMLVSGGLPLALAYLAFVGVIGWLLVRGLRQADPERLPVLAAFGGMWVAYQVQSLVSVDVPALSFLHFLSAGLVVAAASGTSSVSVPLPLAPAARGSLLPRPGSRARPAVAAAMMSSCCSA
jgi:O-antigen ligase